MSEVTLLEVDDVVFCKGERRAGEPRIQKMAVASVTENVATMTNGRTLWRPILNGRVHDYEKAYDGTGMRMSSLHTGTVDLEHEYTTRNLAKEVANTDFQKVSPDALRRIHSILEEKDVE